MKDDSVKNDIKDYITTKKSGITPQSDTENLRQPSTQPTISDRRNPPSPVDGVHHHQPTQPTIDDRRNPASVTEAKRFEMDRVARIISDHMVMSKKRVSPRYNCCRSRRHPSGKTGATARRRIFKREGVALTFMPAIAEATAKALAEFPHVNASVDGYKVILKKHINLGIAVSLPDGNLIVPVIHDADKLNLNGLAANIDTLAAKARTGKLMPDDIQGGTFTITNFGSFKSLFGTPIINQPQVAILGVGFIEKKPAVVETPEGDTIAIRHKMYLSLSYDHRIINGALGGEFLRRVADYLENWDK